MKHAYFGTLTTSGLGDFDAVWKQQQSLGDHAVNISLWPGPTLHSQTLDAFAASLRDLPARTPWHADFAGEAKQ